MLGERNNGNEKLKAVNKAIETNDQKVLNESINQQMNLSIFKDYENIMSFMNFRNAPLAKTSIPGETSFSEFDYKRSGNKRLSTKLILKLDLKNSFRITFIFILSKFIIPCSIEPTPLVIFAVERFLFTLLFE